MRVQQRPLEEGAPTVELRTYQTAEHRRPQNMNSRYEYTKKWRSENKDKSASYTRAWRAKPGNAAKVKAYSLSRRLSPTLKAQASAYDAEKRMTIEGRAKSLIKNARKRGAKYGRDFTITIDDIIPALCAGICQATGRAFDMGPPPEGRRSNPFAPSIDRIDNNVGYIKENIQVVVWAYNLAKGEWSTNELLELSKYFPS